MADEKKPIDMTTDEALNELFPPKVVEELKKLAGTCEDEEEDLES